MNFLLVLVALALEFGVPALGQQRPSGWCAAWAHWLSAQCRGLPWWRGWPAALMIVLVPAFVLELALPVLFSFGRLVGNGASLFVLVMCLGPSSLVREIEDYRRSLLRDGAPPAEGESAFSVTLEGVDLGPPEDDPAFAAARRELAALAVSAERGWFAPVFWFFVLGPVGAVLHRLCAALERSPALHTEVTRAIQVMHELLAFVPARITALNLGVAGTLVPVLEDLRNLGAFLYGRSATLVARAALAAVDHGRTAAEAAGDPHLARLDQMQALIKRALGVWLVEIALATVLI